MRRRKQQSQKDVYSNLLSTGCAMLNSILADNPWGALRKGTIVNIIGDSSAGKSILAFTALASIASNPEFNNYRFIYDDAECADSFNIEKLFGNKLKKRLEAPAYDADKNPIASDTIEDFHMYVKDAVKEGSPFVYILDSFDALDSDADEKKIEEALEARRKGKKSTGSYGSKAKKTSELLRNIRTDLKKTDSILIIISQVRENLNAMAFGSKKTRSGGKALKHYSWYEIWLYLGKKITAKDRQIGVNTIVKIGKNRQTGKIREGTFPIYYDLGIDDVTACVEFLVNEGYWSKKKSTIIAPEIDFEGTKAKMIEYIETNNLEDKLYNAVYACWTEIEESLELHRKKRFE